MSAPRVRASGALRLASALVVGISVASAAGSANAGSRYHRHGRHAAAPSPRAGGGYDALTQGGAVARATERAYSEPGVTQELAPDAKQTATGGPSGGVPGFSGGM